MPSVGHRPRFPVVHHLRPQGGAASPVRAVAQKCSGGALRRAAIRPPSVRQGDLLRGSSVGAPDCPDGWPRCTPEGGRGQRDTGTSATRATPCRRPPGAGCSARPAPGGACSRHRLPDWRRRRSSAGRLPGCRRAMHSLSTCTPTRRLLTGSKAACRRRPSYLSSWTLVITCIRPWAPTPLWANGLKLDSTAMMARIRVGSSPARWPTVHASCTGRLMGSSATR